MKSLGMAGSAMPRVKTSDFDMALQLLTIFGNDKARKQGFTELRDEKAAAVKAREEADAQIAEAKREKEEVREAEAAATRARQALADETATARTELGRREVLMTERERLAGEVKTSQETRGKDLSRRERLLREAGVVLPG